MALRSRMSTNLGSGAYEARRLVPPQISGPEQEAPYEACLLRILPSNTVRSKLFFVGLKTQKIDYGRDFAPYPTELTAY